MRIFGALWRFSYRVLSARVWPGIGVIVALVTLVLNLQVITGILAGLEVPGPARTTSQAEGRLVEFNVFRQVRCPGGGDWLGRERNRRSGAAEFVDAAAGQKSGAFGWRRRTSTTAPSATSSVRRTTALYASS